LPQGDQNKQPSCKGSVGVLAVSYPQKEINGQLTMNINWVPELLCNQRKTPWS
jgi:hypothetical protein